MNNMIPTTDTAEMVKFLKIAFFEFDRIKKLKTFTATLNTALETDSINCHNAYHNHGRRTLKQFIKGFLSHDAYSFSINKTYSQSAIIKLVEEVAGLVSAYKAHTTEGIDNVLWHWALQQPAKVQPIVKSVRQPKSTTVSSSSIDFDVKAYVDQKLESLRPKMISINAAEPIKLEGKIHAAFEECLKLTIIEGQLFISGPAGTGKTTLASQIAQALNLKYAFISCTAGMSEAHLLGRMTASGEYVGTDFVDCYENGGVFLFDEVDAADPNTMLIINSALANGNLSIPNRKEQASARRHPKFYAICAANTWGTGSNEYAGRNILDAAFLDRFVGSCVVIDYDIQLEREISEDYPEVAEAVWNIRAKVREMRIRRVVSTRAIVSGIKARTSGYTLKQYLKRFTTSWSREEVEKVGLN